MLQQKENILAPWTLLDNLYYKPALKPAPKTISIDRTDLRPKRYLSQLDKSKLTTEGHKFLEHVISGQNKRYAITKLGWTQREYLIAKYDFLEACGLKVERPPLPGVKNETLIRHITLTPDQITKLSDRAKLFYELIKKGLTATRIQNEYCINMKYMTALRYEIRTIAKNG